MLIRQIIKLIRFITSNDSPKQMGWGVALALLFSLMPGFNLIHILLLIFVFILQVHLPSFFFFSFIFKTLNYPLLVAVHFLGEYLLRLDYLRGFWTLLYNLPIIPFTKFYNTSVLGGLIIGVVMLYPVQLLMVKLIIFYRKNYQAKINKFIEKSKLMKLLKSSKIYKLYLKYRALRQAL